MGVKIGLGVFVAESGENRIAIHQVKMFCHPCVFVDVITAIFVYRDMHMADGIVHESTHTAHTHAHTHAHTAATPC